GRHAHPRRPEGELGPPRRRRARLRGRVRHRDPGRGRRLREHGRGLRAARRREAGLAGALPAAELPTRERAKLVLQREVGRLLAPLWIPVVVAVMRLGMGWRIEGTAEARRLFRRMRQSSADGLLVCANHLTMVDSFVIAWALAPAWWY